jgi:chemosensory pili system protein ChpA (sensor histidine kinase/response regulator)
MSTIDPGTLGWVKTEIDETLKQARLALESFAENRGDNAQLRFCHTYLHQVVGTLQMVELDGAALLAQENELLAQAMIDGKVEPGSGAFETLVRGILSVPDYLARLQYNQKDSPVRLLPVINELRAARAAEPVFELDLFAPDLSVRPPVEPGERRKTSEEEFIAAARSLRPALQQALLGWLRNASDTAQLDKIGEIVRKLEHQAHVSVIEQLFWVAGGLVEALARGGLEASNDRKKLIGRLDQQIKKLIDGVDKAGMRAGSEALVKAMLFEVGASASHDGRIGELKEAFDLEALLGHGAEEVESEIVDLPTPEALQAVSSALGKEVAHAQELLSAYFDEVRQDEEALKSLIALLQKMSGTLGMLGVPLLKSLVDELTEVCSALSAGSIARPEAASMPMASALLFIESSARDFRSLGAGWKRQIDDAIASLKRLRGAEGAVAVEGMELSDAALTDTDFKQLLTVVAGEIRINLGKVEEALETFAATPDDPTILSPIPTHLSQIQGALEILGQERVAELTGATNDYMQEIQAVGQPVTSVVLDALAVAVGTIGAYIEGLERDRPNVEQLLDVAWRELDSARTGTHLPVGDPEALIADVEKQLALWFEKPANRRVHSIIRQDLRDIATLAAKQDQEKIEKISQEMNNLLTIVTEDPEQFSPDIQATVQQTADILATLTRQNLRPATRPPAAPAAPPKPAARPAPAKPGPPPGMEDLDEEIMQIFIEDAREIITVIDKTLPAWQSAPDNRDVLLELRRAFHTLKGSGRMVGASEIAELAWAVENMLNRVREGKIPYSDPMFRLLDEVHGVLPRMVDQLEGGSGPDADIEALRNRADVMASDGGATEAVEQPAESAPAEPPDAAPAYVEEYRDAPAPIDVDGPADAAPGADEEEPVPRLDPVLLQIFTGEARGHVSTVHNEVEQCRRSGGTCLVTESLLRAAHTMQGSSRALGIRFMAESCSQMEKMLQTYQVRQQPLETRALDLLERVADLVSELIEVMNRGDAASNDLQHRFADLAHDLDDAIHDLSGHEPGGHEPVAAAKRPAESPAARPAAPVRAAPTPMRAAPPPDEPEPVSEAAEDIDPELLEIFLEEAVDILGSIDEALRTWRGDRSNAAAVQDLKRSLHTLKGGARMAGAMNMGSLGHNTESLLKEVEDGRVQAGADLLDLLDEVHDTLVTMVDQMQNRRPVSNVAALNAKVLARLRGGAAPAPRPQPPPARPATPTATESDPPVTVGLRPAPAGPAAASGVNDEPEYSPDTAAIEPQEFTEPVYALAAGAEDATPTADAGDRRAEPAESAEAAAESADRRGQIRVRTSLLNNLVNYAGEVSISRSRMQQQIFGFRENLAELNRSVTRFRDQIRELEIHSESQILYRAETAVSNAGLEFDPLEFDRFSRLQQLSRGLAESLHDLYTIQNNMDNFVGQAETVLQQQARVNTELQEGLMRTRMISFSTQAARLRHIVRQTAREVGKRVELELAGSEVEVDRTVLERMIGPFEHMIRNAIDHGIEDAAGRKRAGKPPVGRITITTAHEGTEIVIRFSDDGAGLNIDAIRRKAVERGLMKDGATLTDEELVQFILVSGFSTAGSISQLSGRGVGMDVVHNEIKQLGGSIIVDTRHSQGTTFVIRLPLTLSITQALMVYVGEQMFAVPLSSVANLLEVPVEKLNNIHMGQKPLLNYNDQVYPFMHLATRLGLTPQPRTTRKVPVLLTRSGSRLTAMQVDGLGGTQEVVIKSLGPQLSRIEGLSGATILGDGRVILILDVPGLWITDERMHMVARREPEKVEPKDTTARRPVIMVVDDSITVRKVTSRYLQKRAMDVMVAKDGIDALEQLREAVPDVMLVDIEMPRMDGYELTTNVRNDPALRHVPIIMITSRAGAKHRDRALQLGVNLYMTKPYQEDELFRNINAMLSRAARG